ncbi:MAG: aminopeptidase N [Burkholderiales bacterium]|nr:aminopeptidase N [Burkholderiales bacterium]
MAANSTVIYRKDYTPPSHNIDSVNLVFDLIPTKTRVTSTLKITPRPGRRSDALELNGENLRIDSIRINGEPALSDQYDMFPGRLVFRSIAKPTEIEIVTTINPQENLQLSGLYMSKGNFITQCEAEGFRRITYFPDRPDVLSKYSVELHAPKDCKVLLSNGNLIEEGELPDGRRYAKWEDPFLKPSYLFALVAGDFVANEESITLADKRQALLQVWVEPGNDNKTAHAMESLKKAIKWDEKKYGLELDLDRFMIVATDDFNMGAMENKGLNIFNSRCVLADENVATDTDFTQIQATIGHEYFHNWTGDRVTCRDWFQLSLKEGLTVFREQEFSGDQLATESAKVVQRLKNVRALKAFQFPEDAGPMAHPVRPESYTEINNFYTMTVYEKGAEVVRMYQTLFGEEGFKKGLQEYIRRHDGSAATCDDFLNAMADANNADLSQFALWYSQAGTPRVSIKTEWNEQRNELTVRARQVLRTFPGQPKPKPMLIPLAIGILDDKGKDVPLQLVDETEPQGTTRVLRLTQEEQSWTFTNIIRQPTLSVGRGFSAPVIFDIDYSRDQLIFLAKNDSDLFNRAIAFEKLSLIAVDTLMNEMRTQKNDSNLSPMTSYLTTFQEILEDDSLSPAYRAEVLKLPSETAVAEQSIIVEPELIRSALALMQKKIGQRLTSTLEKWMKLCETIGPYKCTPELAGKRALRHLMLEYLVASGNVKAVQQARTLFDKGNNLTDKLSGLRTIALSGTPIGRELIQTAVRAWSNEPLLFNKVLQIYALARPSKGDIPTVEKMRQMMFNQAFDIKNPNNVFSLLRTFFQNGGPEFHTLDGTGYQLWIDTVLEIDKFNPQVAARLGRALENWRRYEPNLASMMYKALSYVSAQNNLSNDLREIVDKALYEPV